MITLKFPKIPFVHQLCPLGGSGHMRTRQNKIGTFHKVGECLYCYTSNGVYYARIKTDGKEIKRSLETTGRAFSRQKLAKLGEEQR